MHGSAMTSTIAWMKISRNRAVSVHVGRFAKIELGSATGRSSSTVSCDEELTENERLCTFDNTSR